MQRLNVGIVGCGLISKARHIPACKRLKKTVNLKAVCDLNESLAKETAKSFGIPKAYTDVSSMISNEDLDIVDICVPPQAHAPIALQSMEDGCHVLMEKPMALKTIDCDKMIEASKKSGTKICVIHNALFHSPFLKAKEMVSNGSIGDFVGMRIYLSTPHWDMIDLKDHWYHKLPGGVIGETGPHVAYMSLAFLKDIFNIDVFARSNLNHPWAPFDEFTFELEGSNGFSSIGISYSRNCWSSRVDILGSESSLFLDLENMVLINHKIKKLEYVPLALSSLATIRDQIASSSLNILNVITGRQRIGTEIIIEKFVDSVLNGSTNPVTGEEGRATVELMEKIVSRFNEKYF